MKKNQRKIDPTRQKIDEKSVSAAFGRSGSFQVAPESRGNALGTASGCQVGPSWPPNWPSWLPCWPFWTASWQPRASQTAVGAVPKPCSNACVSSTEGANARKPIFDRFCLVARKLRCASRYSFYSVLLLLDEVSTERASAAKTSQNAVVSAPKTVPRAAKTHQNRARAAKASAKTEVQPQFFSQVRPNRRTERVRTRQERKLERFWPGLLRGRRTL